MTLSHADILNIPDFKTARPRMEQEVLAAKQTRRVHVGEHMMFLFENHLTIQWQIQEMARVEGIQTTEGLAHELKTYNALLPTAESLSATHHIEIQEPAERDRMLHALGGFQDSVRLELHDCAPAKALFDGSQWNEERLSSGQFIRIPLDPDQRAALGDLSRSAALVIDHPAYSATSALTPSTRGALIEDMRGPQ